MPRPKRTRRAPPANDPKPSTTTTNTHDNGDDDAPRGRTRGRPRVTRSAATRSSLKEGEVSRATRKSRGAAPAKNEDPTVTSDPEDTVMSSAKVSQRVAETPLARTDTTGLDLADDSMFGDLGDSFADGQVPEAPHSGASSSGTLSRLRTRRRSRQSSIIGRNDPPIRPSSRGGGNTPGVSSSFNIGVFLRRAREPSILGASRRAPSQTRSVAGSVAGSRAGSVIPDSGSELGLGLDSEGEGELVPEAESTPSKARRQSHRSRNRQLEQKQSSPPASPPASVEPRRRSARKRKSDVDDHAAQSEAVRPAKASRVAANGGVVIGSDSELSDLPSPSPPAAARPPRPMTPVNMDEINAPPASSGSEAADNGIWPDIRTLAKRRRRLSAVTPFPENADHLSDVSTPPSLTHSPNLATARTRGAAKQRQHSPKITTADLTSLLPKRSRKRARDDESDPDGDDGADTNSSDDEDDEDDEDDDEAAYGETLSRQRSRRRKAASRGGRSRANASRGRRVSGAGASSTRRSARTAHKTYRSSEDKENDGTDEDDVDEDDDGEDRENSQFQPLPDNTFDDSAVVPDVRNTEELLKATRKFIEVDQWELSYEEVAEPPSPQDAR